MRPPLAHRRRTALAALSTVLITGACADSTTDEMADVELVEGSADATEPPETATPQTARQQTVTETERATTTGASRLRRRRPRRRPARQTPAPRQRGKPRTSSPTNPWLPSTVRHRSGGWRSSPSNAQTTASRSSSTSSLPRNQRRPKTSGRRRATPSRPVPACSSSRAEPCRGSRWSIMATPSATSSCATAPMCASAASGRPVSRTPRRGTASPPSSRHRHPMSRR